MSADPVSDLISRYGGNLPRYTSYPTAASFSDAVGAQDVESWLRTLPADLPVSLYFHVPFCDELCRFCGCNTSVMRHEDGRVAYGDLLREEMRRVVALTGEQRVVHHLQFGGGTPTTLPPASLRQLMRAVRTFFRFSDDAELAMEMDPRHVPEGYPALLGDLGFNRISLGVQDLDEKVQEACGRHQSFAQTKSCIEQVRAAGVTGVNIDLIYGLPYQTVESVGETARQIALLRPDRLAVFGYAHIPWKQKRQKLIPESALPSSSERLAQRAQIDVVLQAAGYQAIGWTITPCRMMPWPKLPMPALCTAIFRVTQRIPARCCWVWGFGHFHDPRRVCPEYSYRCNLCPCAGRFGRTAGYAWGGLHSGGPLPRGHYRTDYV